MESQTSIPRVSFADPNRLHMLTQPVEGHTSFHAGKTKFCSHKKFLSSTELFYLPDYGGLFGDIVYTSNGSAKPGGISVLWHGYNDLDIIRCRATFELCFCLLLDACKWPTLIIYSMREPE